LLASLAEICARALIIKRLLREIYRKKNAKAKKTAPMLRLTAYPHMLGAMFKKPPRPFLNNFVQQIQQDSFLSQNCLHQHLLVSKTNFLKTDRYRAGVIARKTRSAVPAAVLNRAQHCLR
jgi:hypothetical protein